MPARSGPMPKHTTAAEKQARFIQTYVECGFNATKAAIEAGYSPKTAAAAGSRLLTKVDIQQALAEHLKRLEQQSMMSSIDVLNGLCRIASANILDYFTIDHDGGPQIDLTNVTREQAMAIESIKVEQWMEGEGEDAKPVRRVDFKLNSKLKALETLARIKGLIAQGQKGDVLSDRPEQEVDEETLVEEIILRRTQTRKSSR